MRILILMAVVLGFGSGAAYAGQHNHFAKGNKPYQRSAPPVEEQAQPQDDQESSASLTPEDITPAAGYEEQVAEPTTHEIMVESLQLPRK